MPNIYQKNKTLKAFIVYGAITFSSVTFFIAQTKSPISLNLIFLILFYLIFFTVTELYEVKAGIYALVLAVLMQLYISSFFLAAGYVLVAAYYFLIRALRRRKLDKTSAREKHFRSLANISLQPMILKNEKGEVLFASESVKELLGIKKAIAPGQKISEFIHPEDMHAYDIFLTQLLEWPNEKRSIELRLKKNENGWIWARNDAINLLKHPDVKSIVSSWQDITLQKSADFYKAEILKNEKDARNIAEKAVRDRDEFLSIASHELKTPLTTVLLQLQATLRKILTQSLADFSGKDLLNSLQIAERQSKSLAILIKDLLNVSLASTGRLTLNKERMNLALLVASLNEKYNEEIKISGCEVSIHIKDKEIIGDWDPIRLEQAITNLLMNALKYAKGKKIILTVEKVGDFGFFTIEDKGQGIPETVQQKIFEPFERANSNSSINGLGVGLFITRQIVLAHKGDITVASKAGKGTIFTLKLPIIQN